MTMREGWYLECHRDAIPGTIKHSTYKDTRVKKISHKHNRPTHVKRQTSNVKRQIMSLDLDVLTKVSFSELFFDGNTCQNREIITTSLAAIVVAVVVVASAVGVEAAGDVAVLLI